MTAALIALVASVSRAEMATATGLSYLCRYSGQVIGVAVSSSVLQAVLASELRRRIQGDGAEEVRLPVSHSYHIFNAAVLLNLRKTAVTLDYRTNPTHHHLHLHPSSASQRRRHRIIRERVEGRV